MMSGLQKFAEAAKPLLGKEVTVWTTRLDRPYVRGEFLRFVSTSHTSGLMIAGYGLLPYWEIDRLEHADSGTSLRFAGFMT